MAGVFLTVFRLFILPDLVIKHLVIQKTAAAKCFSQKYLLFFCWIDPETICYVQFFFSPWVSMY